MKLLIQLKQTNNQNKSTLLPLSMMEEVKEIHLVRDYIGHPVPKVSYHLIPGIKNGLFRITAKLILMLYQTIRRNPDVIMGFDIYPHTFSAFICAKLFRKPLISSIRGEVDSMLMPKNKLFLKAAFGIFKRCDWVLVTGTKVKKDLIKKGIKEEKVLVLPNSIDTGRFRPKRTKKTFDLISVGRLSREKRIDMLLRIIAEVKKSRPGISAGIAGTGPEEQMLKRMAKDLKLEKNVTFLGFQDKTEDCFNKGRIYILTSETEGLPQAMLEAMACGLPAVAPDIGDIRDVGSHNKNAFIIDRFDNVKGFAKAINSLLSNKAQYERFAKEATKVREAFSFDSAIKVWRKVLSSW